MDPGVVGTGFQGFPVERDGLVKVAVACRSQSQIVVGFGKVGIDLDGPPPMGHRLVGPAFGHQGKTKVVMGHATVRSAIQGMCPQRLAIAPK